MEQQRRRAGGRRAVRLAGTVGGDESRLRSTFPAVQPVDAPVSGSLNVPDAAVEAPAGSVHATTPAADGEPAVPRRSLDDSDLGWGDRPDDTNDDRLRRNRPPHW